MRGAVAGEKRIGAGSYDHAYGVHGFWPSLKERRPEIRWDLVGGARVEKQQGCDMLTTECK